MHDRRYRIYGAGYMVQDICRRIYGTGYMVRYIWYGIDGTGYMVRDRWYRIDGLRFKQQVQQVHLIRVKLAEILFTGGVVRGDRKQCRGGQ